MKRQGGFNIIELAVVLLLVGGALCLLVACTDSVDAEEQEQRREEREEALSKLEAGGVGPISGARAQMQNNTQVRGIHQGMNIFAQHNKTGTSEGKFPGLDEEGEILPASRAPDFAPDGADGAHPAVRYALLLDHNLLAGDYLIAPIDNKTVWTEGSVLSEENYSYAMLRLANRSRSETHDDDVSRRDEWAETLNSEAPIMSDRNTGGVGENSTSIWTGKRPWRGSVVFNDNHTVFADSPAMETRFGYETTSQDHLFTTDGVAQMVYSDSSSLTRQR